MDLQLEGRVAIVTGASRGLGRSSVTALAAEGAKVLAVARTTEALESLVAESPAGSVVAVTCDMKDRAQVAALPAKAIEAFGRIDVIVNNAGIAPAGRFVDLGDDVWDEVFAVNVF